MIVDSRILPVVGSGFFASTILWSEETVAKVFYDKVDAEVEYMGLDFCSGINDLMPSPVEVHQGRDPVGERVWCLVMERIVPLEFHKLPSPSELEDMCDTFLEQLKELHLSGIAHTDIKRPEGLSPWDNIIVTAEGIRLLDAGRMFIIFPESSDLEMEDFNDMVRKDWNDALEFCKFILTVRGYE